MPASELGDVDQEVIQEHALPRGQGDGAGAAERADQEVRHAHHGGDRGRGAILDMTGGAAACSTRNDVPVGLLIENPVEAMGP